MAERWLKSQEAVETALARGTNTMKGLIHETSYSYKTVQAALARADVLVDKTTWPRTYALAGTAQPDTGEPSVIHLVEPREIDPSTVGTVWQNGKSKIGDEIATLDLTKKSLPEAQAYLREEIASLLGVYVALKSIEDAPDWRERIGL